MQEAKLKKRKNEDIFWAVVLLAPLTLAILLFVAVPILYSIYLSFTKYDMFNPPQWRGLDNYRRLFNFSMETQFWRSFKNILIFAPLMTLLGITVGLLLANLLTKVKKGSGVFKVIFYIPVVCSVVATSCIWAWMYNDVYGPMSILFKALGIQDYNFFAPRNVIASMLFMCLWSGFGIQMLLYFAALRNIPDQLYDAAKIDGASALRTFFYVTFPMVSPTTFYLLLTGLIGNLQAYSQFLAIGLDGYTPVLVVYSYAGHGYGNNTYGYSCAMGIFYGLFVGVIAVLNFRLSKHWVGYDII